MKKVNAIDVILVVVTALFFVGSLFVFGPCGPKEDGSYMTCHWAGNAVSGIAAVMTVTALIHLFVPDDRIKAGLSISVVPTAVLAALIPGRLIGLCMMNDMRCHSVMTPAVMVFSAVIVIAAVVDAVYRIRRTK
ncbi:MAG: DUF4418 family protein [Oscillospiraceae bacterium]|nr:DUF4418 family protein [Oscillospiraceae bacterium]